MKPHSEWCEDPNCPLRIVERGGVAGVGLEDQLNRLQNLPFENDPCANQPPQPAELPKVGDPVECISSETNWEFVRCSVMETDATGFWARDPNEDVTRWLLTDENPSEGHIGWRRVSGLPKIGETVEVWQDGRYVRDTVSCYFSASFQTSQFPKTTWYPAAENFREGWRRVKADKAADERAEDEIPLYRQQEKPSQPSDGLTEEEQESTAAAFMRFEDQKYALELQRAADRIHGVKLTEKWEHMNGYQQRTALCIVARAREIFEAKSRAEILKLNINVEGLTSRNSQLLSEVNDACATAEYRRVDSDRFYEAKQVLTRQLNSVLAAVQRECPDIKWDRFADPATAVSATICRLKNRVETERDEARAKIASLEGENARLRGQRDEARSGSVAHAQIEAAFTRIWETVTKWRKNVCHLTSAEAMREIVAAMGIPPDAEPNPEPQPETVANKPRDSAEVIAAVLKHLPAEHRELREQLEWISKNSEFHPPEDKHDSWWMLMNALRTNLHVPPQLDWEKRICEIVEGRATE